MAEKQEGEDVPVSSQGLTCPLCLDIFDDATLLTCGHTFCRTCLRKYDLSHQDLDHMVCPLCRTVTKLSANRVDDLLTNVTVNGLVDDYHDASSGGANAILKMRQKCTVCNLQVEPIAFCTTCNVSMCDQCHVGHKRLQMFFEGHEIVSIQDIIEGNVTPSRPSEKCSVHRLENKDMFCQDCKMRVCFKCVVIDHRDHKIKSHKDFEKEMQVKVSDLLHRCKAKKSELEKNIQTVETHRHEAHSVLQLLRDDVSQACRTKVKQLEDNRGVLVEKIDVLERSFDEALNGLKSNDRQMIKSICSSVDLVANDRLGCLETDSLVAHTFLCEEIDGLLKEVIDQTSAATIREKAQKQRFKPAADTSLDLGNITETVRGQLPPGQLPTARLTPNANYLPENCPRQLLSSDATSRTITHTVQTQQNYYLFGPRQSFVPRTGSPITSDATSRTITHTVQTQQNYYLFGPRQSFVPRTGSPIPYQGTNPFQHIQPSKITTHGQPPPWTSTPPRFKSPPK
ncbi:E3 ubiquitin-protein ligase Midline-1-like [Strongylocentrotus purpuratus]|uniref:Uncharacterized protein n=1 Tax=Strongylocentrotus purpuratus TaxID=7668 RepID=A0A7M7P0K7_STRPU|nr:E3 ubiquitin-protein ligase Midline-1-like [Strongylocentrotus purpuratus]